MRKEEEGKKERNAQREGTASKGQPVRVVERLARELRVGDVSTPRRVLVSLDPGVEDPKVVIHSNECDQGRNRKRRFVLLVNSRNSGPKEDRARRHGGEGEREHIVDELELAVADFKHCLGVFQIRDAASIGRGMGEAGPIGERGREEEKKIDEVSNSGTPEHALRTQHIT